MLVRAVGCHGQLQTVISLSAAPPLPARSSRLHVHDRLSVFADIEIEICHCVTRGQVAADLRKVGTKKSQQIAHSVGQKDGARTGGAAGDDR